ncbi:MAG: hypothetical protein DKINENOH_01460 [bacterium]|nr:hypothetical protein [bacterium]
MSPTVSQREAVVLFRCWEQIFIHTKQPRGVRAALEEVRKHFQAHPRELRVNRHGHLRRSLGAQLRGLQVKLRRYLPSRKTGDSKPAFDTLLAALQRRSHGLPSLEDSYVIIFQTRQLAANQSVRRRWGDCWRYAVRDYFARSPHAAVATALENGIIVGYNVRDQKIKCSVDVGLLGRKKRVQWTIAEIDHHLFTTDAGLLHFLAATFREIKPKLVESEKYLLQYKTRNITAALAKGVLLAAPFVFLGYVADYFLLPLLATTGIVGRLHKLLEVVIRYFQGCLDTILQYHEIKKSFASTEDHPPRGAGLDEYKAARLGVAASALGPVTTIVAPMVGIAETSKAYAVVAVTNANIDNLASALRKAVTNIADAKAAELKWQDGLKHVLKDTYVIGNLLGSLMVLGVDVGGRTIIAPTFFEFLRTVALEGMVIGMLDSEITTIVSKAAIEYQNRKWKKRFNVVTFQKSYEYVCRATCESEMPRDRSGAPPAGPA